MNHYGGHIWAKTKGQHTMHTHRGGHDREMMMGEGGQERWQNGGIMQSYYQIVPSLHGDRRLLDGQT